MPKETMNPRERWLAVLTRRLPDRTPLDYWATEEFNARLLSYLGEADLRTALQKLHVDFVVTATPRYVGPRMPHGTDVFGCRYQKIDYGTGTYDECIYHPLAQFNSVAEIEAARIAGPSRTGGTTAGYQSRYAAGRITRSAAAARSRS